MLEIRDFFFLSLNLFEALLARDLMGKIDLLITVKQETIPLIV